MMGYFVAFEVMIQAPLVYILTDQYVQIVLYPFQDDTGIALINVVVLPKFPLFENGSPYLCTLNMIVLLAKYLEVNSAARPVMKLLQIPDNCLTMSRIVLQEVILTKNTTMAKITGRNAQVMKKKMRNCKR